jgi:hypothetical protein
MNHSGRFYFALLLSVILFSLCLYAQDSTYSKYPQKIILKDGTVLCGKIVKQDSLRIQFQLNEGKLKEFPKRSIKSMQPVSDEFRSIPKDKDITLSLYDGTQVNGRILSVNDTLLAFRTISGIEMTIPLILINVSSELKGEVINGVYYRKDPTQSHLFIAPTARPIEAGNVYFTDYLIFFPSINVGVTDFLSAGAGISVIPGAQNELLYGNIKATFLNKNFSENSICIAGGAAFANTTAGNTSGSSVFYALVTYSRNPFSLTVGFIDPNQHNANILLLGGELRLSNSVKLISEDYYSPTGEFGVYSFGIRFFSDKIAGDFGFFTYRDLLDYSGFPFIPWLGFTYNF